MLFDLGFHYQNCKHLGYFGFYLTVHMKNRYDFFVSLFVSKVTTTKVSFFTNSAVKMQYVLFSNEPFLWKILVLILSFDIPPYIHWKKS